MCPWAVIFGMQTAILGDERQGFSIFRVFYGFRGYFGPFFAKLRLERSFGDFYQHFFHVFRFYGL